MPAYAQPTTEALFATTHSSGELSVYESQSSGAKPFGRPSRADVSSRLQIGMAAARQAGQICDLQPNSEASAWLAMMPPSAQAAT